MKDINKSTFHNEAAEMMERLCLEVAFLAERVYGTESARSRGLFGSAGTTTIVNRGREMAMRVRMAGVSITNLTSSANATEDDGSSILIIYKEGFTPEDVDHAIERLRTAGEARR